MKKAKKWGWTSKSRLLAWMLIVSMIVTVLPVQQAAGAELPVQRAIEPELLMQQVAAVEPSGFQDVRPTDWFYEAAAYVRKNGIFSGTGGGLFSPKGTMTRAMYVTALGRMAGVDVSEYSTTSFADVPEGIWYAPYVAWAVKKGITSGTGARNFSPDATVSREQMAALTLRYFESYRIPYLTGNPVTTQPGDLANVSSWAADAVVKLWQAGVFDGDSNGNFNPHQQATRAEAAVFFMRNNAIVEVWKNQNPTAPTPTPTPMPTPTPTPMPTSGPGGGGGGSGSGGSGGNINNSQHLITFESNGGTAVTSQTVKYGSKAVEPEVPTKTGYTFGGWYSDSILRNAYSFTTTVTDNITLYAKWLARYTMSFDSNGGSAVADQTVNEGAKVAAPSAPTKNGYVFSGWYSDSDLTIAYDFTTAVVKGNITLYAKWSIDKKNSYTVKFISNGGTGVVDQSVEEGAVAAAPDAPTRAGYTFGGWYSDSNLTSYYGFTAAVTGNITLYAKWLAHYTVSFDSKGGSAVAAQTVREGEALSKLPAPAKEGYIFQGWFRDSDLSLIFAEGSSVTEDTKLYAKYIDSVSKAIQSIPSYSVLNVAPSFTIAVNDASGSLTALDVQERITFEDTSDPDFAGITVTGGNGLFTVASAAEDSLFTEGNTYQLTLTDDNLSFQGQDATTSIYVFSVAKQAVMKIPLNPNLIYLPFADVTNMMLDGAEVGSPAIPVVTTTVGGSESGLAAANAGSGTFTYTGSAVTIQVGDTVAIYEGVRPDLRTVGTTGAADGAVAYVQITAVNGTTYTYDHADVKQVLFKPDVLPVSVEADTDGDPNNRSITVAHTAMNYSDSGYAPLGLSELTTVDVGDFIAFYEGAKVEDASRVIGYGRITSITPAAEMDVITYDYATEEEIKHTFDIYQQQAIDGDTLLSDEEIAQLEDQIEQQALASGFVDQAADYLSTLATETDAFKTLMEVNMLSAKAVGKVKVENLTVVASLSTKVKNISGQTSGVSASLQVGADIVIRIHEESDLVIHMTGTFLQEISLNLGVNGGTEWGEACVWILCVPYPRDYRITANLDAYSYTGLNITAKIATVEHDKLQDVLDDWDKALYDGKLGKMRDIATEIQALLDGVQDASVDIAALKEQYKEMLEDDTEWVPLIKKKLFEQSVRVVFGLIEVNFSAEFVVSAKVNLTIGADFNYTTAKRFSATVRVLSFTATSSTVSLPGDGNYQFTFYVMGTIGLRAGIQLELKAGIGSVKLNSIGISVEPGAYVNLWGYFYYQLKNVDGVRSTKSLGALFVEMGIYLESAIGASLGDGLLSTSVPIYNNTWPLYSVGEQLNVDDFAYPQDDKLGVTLSGSATYTFVPKSWLTMSIFDLKTGETDTQTYDPSRFDIQVDNPSFRYDRYTQKIEVVNKNNPVSEGNLVITWKGAPLSFTSEPLQRVIPLTYLARKGDYTLQLHPQNGKATQVVTAAYNAVVNAATPIYAGYTFDGWYTAASGGAQVTIPSRMPAEDVTLYAHWTANTDTPYTVQHYLIDANTRTATTPEYTESKTGTTDTEIRINSNKYEGQGYMSSTLSGVLIKGDGSTVAKLYYYPANRKMTFDLGYAGAPGSTFTELVGKNIAARIPQPTRQGYTFSGWSPEVPGTMPNADTAYTAKWTARADTPYQVVYLLQNIGSDTYTVADTESYRGTTGAMADTTTVTLKSYAGFTIDHSVPGTLQAAVIKGDGTTVLKVYYKRNNYAMTLDYNGAGIATQTVNVPYGATTSLHLGDPAWQGHTFAGWSPAPPATMPSDNVTLTAQWTLNSYTVSFDSGGGSTVNAQTIGYGFKASLPDAPTQDGMAFAGWYSDRSLTTAYDFTSAVVTADVTLYAKWLHRYTVSFDSKGGSAVTSQTVNEGAQATAPVAPTLEGYVFSGWYRESALMNAYDFTTAVVTANLTLYAKWSIVQKNRYTLSFDSKGGTAVADQTVEEGAVAVAPTAPTRVGYTFDGWYSNSGLTDAYGFTAAVTGDLMLYAKWTINSYWVSFVSNGGSSVDSQQVNHGYTAVAPVAPTRAGYAFKGWYTTAALNTAYDFATVVTANRTLFAKWTAVYTVSFNSDGGSSVADQQVEYGGTATMPATPTKSGYTFGGWFSNSGLTDGYSFTAPVTGYVRLYAKWTLNSYTVSFNSNGGTAVTSQTVSVGGTATAPNAPVRAGHTFEGWYIDLAGTTAYDFATAVTTDITLYAKWTQSAWQQVGDIVGSGYVSRLVFDSRGTPYVTYVTDPYGAPGRPTQIVVKKYEQGAWRNAEGTPLDRTSSNYAFALDRADVPYLVSQGKNSSGEDALVVDKYKGSKWERVGSRAFPFTYATIALDNGNTPYLAHSGWVMNADPLIVVKYEEGNGGEQGDWRDVSGGETLKLASKRPTIAFDRNDTPYLFHLYDKNPNDSREGMQWIVMKYEANGWRTLGTDNTDIASFALAPDGTPYVVYRDQSAAGDPTSEFIVKRYDSVNETWQLVGDPGAFKIGWTTSGLGFFTTRINIAFDGLGAPYVLYQDALTGGKLSVVKYDEEEWSYVGNSGFSVSNLRDAQLAIDNNDNMYVIYTHNQNGETAPSAVTVLKYDPQGQSVSP
ncbi:InlB B-repeat-containing protein [Cohnella sp. LGH]|uniref:InlB B-repeat-containing protein n=1 Tax=Cohnella sp. LGH TaxID=1619153 RepID=UPI001ADBA359|nr:InlB B-repeat-containing protein [Cohnella sp. LGH]QTH40696.1 InlB B-repeat-containing protein [Cohnella sp. LGH]